MVSATKTFSTCQAAISMEMTAHVEHLLLTGVVAALQNLVRQDGETVIMIVIVLVEQLVVQTIVDQHSPLDLIVVYRMLNLILMSNVSLYLKVKHLHFSIFSTYYRAINAMS